MPGMRIRVTRVRGLQQLGSVDQRSEPLAYRGAFGLGAWCLRVKEVAGKRWVVVERMYGDVFLRRWEEGREG